MRKGIYAIIVAVYLLLSSGVVVRLHFCMDRLAQIGFFSSDHQDTCDDCGMAMNAENDCCQDRTDVIKLIQDQTFHPVSTDSAKITEVELSTSVFDPFPIQVGQLNPNPIRTNPPDPLVGRYRYRTLQVFRI